MTDPHPLVINQEKYTTDLFQRYSYFYNNHNLSKLSYRLHIALAYLLWRHFDHSIKFQKVLDLGCGTGLIGWILKPLSESLIGVDISHNMLEECSDTHLYDQLYRGEIKEYIMTAKESFDLMCCVDTFSYIKDLNHILSLCFEQLKSNSYFIGSIEPIEEDSFIDCKISETGRFLHSYKKVQNIFYKFDMKEIDSFQTIMRIENGKPIASKIFLVRKE